MGHTALPPPPQLRARSRRPLIIGLVAGVVALAIIGTVVGFAVLREGKGEMALKFFGALRAADAAEAMSYLAEPVTDTSLLTDDVLRKSNELGGISRVEVTRTSATWVTLTMTVTGREEQVQYKVAEVDGRWKILDGVKTYVLPDHEVGVPPIVNGAKPSSPRSLTVFPGVYEFGTGTVNLVWRNPRQTFLIGIPSHDPSMGLEVTDTGTEAARMAVVDALTRCAHARELDPEGCPFPVGRPRAGLNPESVRWDITSQLGAGWTPSLRGTSLTGLYKFTARLQYEYDDGHGAVRRVDQPLNLMTMVSADLAAERIPVTFGA